VILIKYVLILFSIPIQAQTRIAVIDTGYRIEGKQHPKFCKEVGYDFATRSRTVTHPMTHGTYVTNIIANTLQDKNYCILEYQVVADGGINSNNISLAIRMATDLNAKYINMSIVGHEYNRDEREAMMYAVSKGVVLFLAAGNDDENLSCKAYPACYPIAHIIGAIDNRGRKCPWSNYGSMITSYYSGELFADGRKQCATSFATPRALAAYFLAHQH
jgi:subtilisin family serine protease